MLWPSLTGEEPAGTTVQYEIPPAPAEQNAQPTLPPTESPAPVVSGFEQIAAGEGVATGTFVGQKVAEMRAELQRLRATIASHNAELQQVRNATIQNVERYHGTVAAINARLQVGTTPGNPALVDQWNQAQEQLNRVNGDIGMLSSLTTKVSDASSMAAYLLDSARAAYSLAGAVEEDHRQLAMLEDEVNKTVVMIERLLIEFSEDVNRQTTYVSRERSNLLAMSLGIKSGQLFGVSLANRPFAPAAPIEGAAAGAAGRPLVIIRFDRPDVEYEQALYTAVSRALERRPDATFELVAVAPSTGTAGEVALGASMAKRDAETVLRSLANMGLPPDRITLSATTSATAQTNEVHIYVR
ncbi:MAG: hypothetical protein ACE5KL_02050 [Alphaproteobacteria bacterium]